MLSVRYNGPFRPDARYAFGVVNVTNRCNLECRHCFIYRDGNANAAPEDPRREPSDDELLETLAALRDRHGIKVMLWMGGEPMLRRGLIERGVALFDSSHVITNGTIPLVELGPRALYVVSLDGPEAENDALRGDGVYRRVLRNLGRLPEELRTPVQVQCTVTRKNQHALAKLVAALEETAVQWMTFTFHVPAANDQTGCAWPTLEERLVAVEEVRRLTRAHPGFVRNSEAALDLMTPEQAPAITARCPARAHVLSLYLEEQGLTTPHVCCYGNDVDCSRCGAWVVFQLAALERARAEGKGPASRLTTYQAFVGSTALG
ncbi:MAG: radical SAM protein [Deltaproteobacteria bacterium]|nr:radical SAM protein [Deltaproteobacteria bacterium]